MFAESMQLIYSQLILPLFVFAPTLAPSIGVTQPNTEEGLTGFSCPS